jgi:protein-L-isoaspartate O-methyltransferase
MQWRYDAATPQARFSFVGTKDRRPSSWSETKGRLPRTKVIPENTNKALHAWQTSARYWDKYRALITKMFAPLTLGLVEEAQIGIGKAVLDIGGGSGEPSLTISRIVGPTGSVTYTDLNVSRCCAISPQTCARLHVKRQHTNQGICTIGAELRSPTVRICPNCLTPEAQLRSFALLLRCLPFASETSARCSTKSTLSRSR